MPKKSPAFTTSFSAGTGLPPPVPQDAVQDDYVVEDVNTKIARPEEYNEIAYKAVDPMSLRRKKKGGRTALARSQLKENRPTGMDPAKSAMVMNGPPPVPQKRMSAPSPFLQRKKSPKHSAPKKLRHILCGSAFILKSEY